MKTFYAEGVRRKIPAGDKKRIPDYGDKNLFPPGAVAVDAEKCTGCKLCVNICPVAALEMVEKSVVMKNPQEHECFMCGACYSICEPKAIQAVDGAHFSGRFTDIDRGQLTSSRCRAYGTLSEIHRPDRQRAAESINDSTLLQFFEIIISRYF